MSWTSRLGGLGRFSPFTRSGPQESSQVSDADFSYITTEDLKRHQAQNSTHTSARASSPLAQNTPVDLGPERDTDVLVLRNKRVEYPVHFPAYSIAKGELTIGAVRECAAKKTGTADPRRVKLLYRGKNMKDDTQRCVSEGLRDGAELLLTISDYIPSNDGSSSEDDFEDPEGAGSQVGADGLTAKARRNRRKRDKKKGKSRNTSGTSTPTTHAPEFLGAAQPIPRTSRPASPKPPSTPATPIDKLNALRATLQSYEQDVEAFLGNPPVEKAKRDYEHKRLSETILTQVLLKLDGVETEGDQDARQRRRDLVKETQAVLKDLDDAVKVR